MQKQTEGRLSRTSACEQTGSHAILRVNNISLRDALHDHFPSSFFIVPKCCFIVLAFRVCIPLLLGKYKYPPLCTKTSDGPSTRAQPSSIHQQRPCSTRGPPSSAHHPQPALWHNAVVAFRAFMLAVVWGRLKTLCVRRPLSWVAGRNLLGCEWRDRNAHMNGPVCAGHLLTEGRRASMSPGSSA